MEQVYHLRQLASAWELRRHRGAVADLVSRSPGDALDRFERMTTCWPAMVMIIDRHGNVLEERHFPPLRSADGRSVSRELAQIEAV